MGNEITITNDKGRLSQDEIERMVSEEVAGKIPEDQKAHLDATIEDTINWLDANPAAEKEEYEEKQKSLEGVAMPILQQMAGGAGGMPGAAGGMPGGPMPDMGGMGGPPPDMGYDDPAGGPTIEEID